MSLFLKISIGRVLSNVLIFSSNQLCVGDLSFNCLFSTSGLVCLSLTALCSWSPISLPEMMSSPVLALSGEITALWHSP